MDLLKTACFCCESILLLVRRTIKCHAVGSCENWLSFTYKQVKKTIQDHENTIFIKDIVRLFVIMYETYATHTNEQAGFEMILQELLPYSFTNYEQYVLAKNSIVHGQSFISYMGLKQLNC